MKVALYVRVSKDDDMQNPANQLNDLRAFVERQDGWSVIAEYVERASAKDVVGRPQFQRMMTDAQAKKFELLLFWALDRFSREGTLVTMQLLQQLSVWGVEWRSYQESYLDSCGPLKDVVISLMATLAKQERLRISARTKAGLERVRKEGRKLGPKFKDIDIDAVSLLYVEGCSLRQIAKEVGVSHMTVNRIVKGKR